MPKITTASVRIMRSYDYNNFEVTLGTDQPVTPAEVEALSAEAARLADKAVDAYIAAGHSSKSTQPAEHSTSSQVSSREDGTYIDHSYSQEA